MTTLNAVFVRVADAVLQPLQGLPALAVILAVAFVTALVVLGVMRAASNQVEMAAVKRRIHADLLEMRLYNDDVRALLRAQGSLLRHNAAYIWLSMLPLVITALPLAVVIAQVQSWYGYVGLDVGQPALVTADLRGREPAPTELPSLDAPGLDVDGPGMYFPSLRQVVWRVVPRQTGTHLLQVRFPAGEADVEKSVHVGDAVARRSPSREGAGFLHQLLYPSEAPLPDDGPVAAVRLDYPDRAISVLGADVHWLWVYLVATFAFVLALRKPLGVVI